MRRLAYRIGRIVGAFLRRHLVRAGYVEVNAAHVNAYTDLFGGGVQTPATRAQRIERVRQAADLRFETGMAACHLAEWETELAWAGSEGFDL